MYHSRETEIGTPDSFRPHSTNRERAGLTNSWVVVDTGYVFCTLMNKNYNLRKRVHI